MEENNPQTPPQRSFFSRYKWYIIGIGALLAFNLFSSESSSSSDGVTIDYVEEEVLDPTQGVITTVEEVQAEVFKITDEELVPTKAESRVIAQYLDGTVDTFTLEQVALIDTTITERSHTGYRRSMMGSVVMWGMMGYVMGGRSMGSPLRRSAYASSTAYNKSSTAGMTQMRSSATRSTVRKPSTTSSRKTGYGSGKSTRSYGG